ncbi:unnamed protein product [Psylliodes chrysocephalus]|uniref:Uncharacterized protein n=1 Tax=Psylliodes chrysocephalus TaxID=3402493 RepID=A0A9P0CUJ1_9CUCU|nr:unnamed protein product [Psylliodes chrysocephala]
MSSTKKSKSKRKQSKRKINVKKSKKLKTITLSKAIQKIKKQLLISKPQTLGSAIQLALKVLKSFNKKISKPRVIKVPKTGGILPLIPIFAGLSALGALTRGAASIAKAVGDAKAAKEQLLESHRHNKTMESIAIGKGLDLKPYKSGLGLFL